MDTEEVKSKGLRNPRDLGFTTHMLYLTLFPAYVLWPGYTAQLSVPLSSFLPQCLCTCYFCLETSSTNLHVAASLSSFELHLLYYLFREALTDPTG